MSLFILIWLVFVVVAKLIFNLLFSTFLSISKALALPVPERFFDNGREFTTCHLCRTGRKISLSLNTRNTKQKFIRWIEKEEHSKDRFLYLSGTTANLQAANIKITSKGTKWPLKKQIENEMMLKIWKRPMVRTLLFYLAHQLKSTGIIVQPWTNGIEKCAKARSS